MAEARKMANAAKAAGLRNAIRSTLADTRRWVPLSDERMPTLMGKHKVPHFDAKSCSSSSGTSRTISAAPATRRWQ